MPRPPEVNPFKGKNVLIKPNFNTSDETPGSTHNETLKAILERAREMGAKGLTIGDRSGPEPTAQVFDKKGIPALAGSFDATLLNFDELGAEGYVKVTPPGSHWKDGFLIAKPVVGAECLVSTCCLKTHQYGGVFTMSLKNSVGTVPRKGTTLMRELHSSPDQRRMIAEINFAYKPALIVLDGLVAFVDQGPMDGAAQGRRGLPGRNGPGGRRRGGGGHPQAARLERRHHEAGHLRPGADRPGRRAGARRLVGRRYRHRDARRGERGLRGEDPGHPRGRLSPHSGPNGFSIETASRPPRCRAPFSVTTMQSSMRMPNSP